MKIRYWHLILLLFLITMACRVATPDISFLQSGSALFEDDFSNTSSGWDRVHGGTYLMDYSDGTYRMFVAEPMVDIWSNPGLSYDDVVVEVEATMAGGPDDNAYGLICRSNKDVGGYYFFIISSDGYYAIGKVAEGKQILLGSEVMQPSNTVRRGYTMNHIRAECIGDRLTLYVNGEKLSEVHDADYLSGDVGIMAGSLETPGVYVHFDNFLAKSP